MAYCWGANERDRLIRAITETALSYKAESVSGFVGSDGKVHVSVTFPDMALGAAFWVLVRAPLVAGTEPMAESCDLLPGDSVTGMSRPVTLHVIGHKEHLFSMQREGLR